MIASAAGKSFRKSAVAVMALLVLVLSCLPHAGFAGVKDVDVKAFIAETQMMTQAEKSITMLWWIPFDYWVIMNVKAGILTEAAMKDLKQFYDDYVIIIAIKSNMGSFGVATYEQEDTIRKDIRLIDGRDTRYAPFEQEDLTADALNFTTMMRPILANMLGPLGQNMHIFLFPSRDSKGKEIANTSQEGSFSIQIGKEEFKWRLPLGSILSQKTCPVDKEKLSGAWKYCPWHGVKLD